MSEPAVETPTDLFAAPRPHDPVDRTVSLPGSKSLTNRALLLAAIAEGPSVLRRPLRSRDTVLMASALSSLGTTVEDRDGDWSVIPGPGTPTPRSTAAWPAR